MVDRRKKVWEENDTNPHVFPHKLLDEVELQSIFDCTAEVGHFRGLNWVIEYMGFRSCMRSIMQRAHLYCTLQTTLNVVILPRHR